MSHTLILGQVHTGCVSVASADLTGASVSKIFINDPVSRRNYVQPFSHLLDLKLHYYFRSHA